MDEVKISKNRDDDRIWRELFAPLAAGDESERQVRAARFAEHKVRLVANEAPADLRGVDPGRRSWVELVVEDDGPGLEPDQIREAMKRGRRLDESKPGTGLGLSIVSEITNEYQGSFQLSRGEWGGLKASLILPGVTKDVA